MTAPGTSALPVSVIIPALDEALNLPAALESVAWADEVFVVDSGSSDRTVEIAEAAGAHVVRFDYRPETGLKKKAWALANLPLRNEWVFLLDADERVTPALAGEIARSVAEQKADGFYVDREFVFMGRSLRCFRPNWNMRLFRRGRGHIEDLGLHGLPGTGDNEIHEHVTVEGTRGFLHEALLHDDYRGLSAWLDRHNRYSTWEAHLYHRFRKEPIGVGPAGFLRLDAFQRKRVLRRIWVRLPGRPVVRFFVWYFGRRGFADGSVGFIFCVLMSWYELTIGLKLRELEAGPVRAAVAA